MGTGDDEDEGLEKETGTVEVEEEQEDDTSVVGGRSGYVCFEALGGCEEWIRSNWTSSLIKGLIRPDGSAIIGARAGMGSDW